VFAVQKPFCMLLDYFACLIKYLMVGLELPIKSLLLGHGPKLMIPIYWEPCMSSKNNIVRSEASGAMWRIIIRLKEGR